MDKSGNFFLPTPPSSLKEKFNRYLKTLGNLEGISKSALDALLIKFNITHIKTSKNTFLLCTPPTESKIKTYCQSLKKSATNAKKNSIPLLKTYTYQNETPKTLPSIPFNKDYTSLINEIAKIKFNINALRPFQLEVINKTLNAFDTLHENFTPSKTKLAKMRYENMRESIVILPTGYGKSLCFQLPALILPGLTIIVYPLLSLMHDQYKALNALNIPCVLLKGGQTKAKREQIFKKLEYIEPLNKEESLEEKKGTLDCKIVITNPETLSNPRLLSRLSRLEIMHLVVDEAHCLSEWGDTFRPAYLKLNKIVATLSPLIVTCFSATSSVRVIKRISQHIFKKPPAVIKGSIDRPNIRYYVKECYDKESVLHFLAKCCPHPLLIFCGTRREAEKTASSLSNIVGIDKVTYYHAGLNKRERSIIEKWFNKSEDGILCATCAYGMGVDKKNIRTVIHIYLPPTIEEYLQETGRIGRDDLTSYAILLHDKKMQVNKYRSSPLLSYITTSTCRRNYLINYMKGEAVLCSGCDICSKNSPQYQEYKASSLYKLLNIDKLYYKYIKRHHRVTKEEARKKLLFLGQKSAFDATGGNFFYEDSYKNAIKTLLDKNKIQVKKSIFKDFYAIVKKKKRGKDGVIRRVFLHRYFHLLFSLRSFLSSFS